VTLWLQLTSIQFPFCYGTGSTLQRFPKTLWKFSIFCCSMSIITMKDGGIPVVDLKGLPSDDAQTMAEITKDIDKGLKSHSCLQLVGHGVPKHVVSFHVHLCIPLKSFQKKHWRYRKFAKSNPEIKKNFL